MLHTVVAHMYLPIKLRLASKLPMPSMVHEYVPALAASMSDMLSRKVSGEIRPLTGPVHVAVMPVAPLCCDGGGGIIIIIQLLAG